MIGGELGNQTNHDRHLKSDRSSKSDLLYRTLIGNILSMAKGIGLHCGFADAAGYRQDAA